MLRAELPLLQRFVHSLHQRSGGSAPDGPPRLCQGVERNPRQLALQVVRDQRVVPLPIPAADLSNLQAGPAGQIYYLQAPAARGEGPQGSTLYRTLFLAALLLFAVTFVVNTLAELVRQRLRRRYASL